MTNSSLNLHIWKSTVRLKAAHNISPLKIPFEKCKSLGWLSEFCTTLFIWYWRKFGCKFKTHRIRIKINNLETEELLFEINMKLCNMRFEKIKIWEGHKKVITNYYLKILAKKCFSIIFSNICILRRYVLLSSVVWGLKWEKTSSFSQI